MRTRLLPILALALASTVGCTPTPPTMTSTQPQADTQRQIAQADDDMPVDEQSTQAMEAERQLPKPLSVQELPQRLEPSQVVELPEDKIRRIADVSETMDEARSTMQASRRWRGGGYRRGLRYYNYGGFYYPYYSYGSYYYPYAYYPYTYAYYPYSYYSYWPYDYYSYGYYPYAYYPYYSYGSYYIPYGYYSYYGGRRYGRYWNRGGRSYVGGRSFSFGARGGRGGRR